MNQNLLRNIAIIAHVDHGKTTLVDAMLKQTQTFANHQKELEQTTILDSNDLERERGVTILAKNTAVFWHDYKINILDTPGHADFSGEVERVLNMADGCVLLIDAAEGVLSQTKFVLRLALEQKLRPIVVLNKVDRKDQQIAAVEREVADLFLDLAVDARQLDFPILYARGADGIAGRAVAAQADGSLQITDSADLTPLFEAIVKTVPAPLGEINQPLQIQVNSLDFDAHKGRIVIGRIFRGQVKRKQKVALLTSERAPQYFQLEYLFTHHGLNRLDVEQAAAGEIVALTGLPTAKIGDTICSTDKLEALPHLAISEPTVKIQMLVNTSPFAGREKTLCTSRQLRARLEKELETNVGLRLLAGSTGESMTLVGRGELHLAILIETLRRENYEFGLSRPEVVIREINDVKCEPWEAVTIEVSQDYTGVITAAMAKRRGQLMDMRQLKHGVRFEYQISTANLIGFRTELLTDTSGEGVLYSAFLDYRPLSPRAETHRGGAIISHEVGQVTAYALDKAQSRGTMFVDPGDEVYSGQVVGINQKPEDMMMNVTKGKKLTNMRAASADATVVLAPAWHPSLEQFLTLIAADEVLEVTPTALRLRKIA